jgi:hypothetical protein
MTGFDFDVQLGNVSFVVAFTQDSIGAVGGKSPVNLGDRNHAAKDIVQGLLAPLWVSYIVDAFIEFCEQSDREIDLPGFSACSGLTICGWLLS